VLALLEDGDRLSRNLNRVEAAPLPLLLFTIAVAGLTALVTGLWPRGQGHRSRQALVVAEVALSVALLIGAALLRSAAAFARRTRSRAVPRPPAVSCRSSS
jgi:hypothetical protein